MKKISLFILSALFIIQYSFAQHKKESITELKEFTGLYMEDNDFDGAIPLLKKLDSLEKKNPQHAFQLGVCYMNTGRPTQAIPYFEKAASLNHHDPELEFYLGKVAQLKNNFDEAKTHFTTYQSRLNRSRTDYNERNIEINWLLGQCDNGKKLVSQPLNIKIENLGSPINTIYPEYVPLISGDEKTMIFTSRRPNTTGGDLDDVDNLYYEDIYIAYNQNNKWSEPTSISKNINTKHHDACVGISHDGKILLVYKPDKKSKLERAGDIYRSERIGNDWTSPVKMDEPINSKFWEPSATISANDSIIIFSSNRPGGLGGLDLYYSIKQASGKWCDAVNFGPSINTMYDEDAPYIHADNKTLYFSSKGHYNMGGYDIFVSSFDVTTKTWSNAENIGFPLNSADQDIYFVWNDNATKAYFSSYRADSYGDKDIYTATKIKLENGFIAVNGLVLDTVSNKSIKASVNYFDLKTGKNVATVKTDTANGGYKTQLKIGKNYLVKVVSEGYFYKEEIVKIDSLNTLFELKKNFYLKPLQVTDKNLAADYASKNKESLSKSDLKKLAKGYKSSDTSMQAYLRKDYRNKFKLGDKLVFNSILFDEGKSKLNANSLASLEEIYAVMESYPEIKIEITGHTDSIGKPKANRKLSTKRAKVVASYLEKRGIKKQRLTAFGLADNAPISTNATEEGRLLNRRTEFKVVGIDTTLINNAIPEFKMPELPKQTEHIAVEKVKRNKLRTLAHFGYNSSFLTDYSKDKLSLVIKELTDNPSMKIRIHAYSDPLGKHDYNYTLSEKRGQVIKDYLVSQGINAERLSIESDGDKDPLLNSADKSENVLNRRVEFEIISE